MVPGAGVAGRRQLRHVDGHQPAGDVPGRHLRPPAHRHGAGLGPLQRVQRGARVPARPAVGPGRPGLPGPSRAVRRHRGAPRHQAAVRPVRLLLGSVPAGRAAAGADARGAQLRLGAESGRRAPRRPRLPAHAAWLRHRGPDPIPQRRPDPGLGSVERARQSLALLPLGRTAGQAGPRRGPASPRSSDGRARSTRANR